MACPGREGGVELADALPLFGDQTEVDGAAAALQNRLQGSVVALPVGAVDGLIARFVLRITLGHKTQLHGFSRASWRSYSHGVVNARMPGSSTQHQDSFDKVLCG